MCYMQIDLVSSRIGSRIIYNHQYVVLCLYLRPDSHVYYSSIFTGIVISWSILPSVSFDENGEAHLLSITRLHSANQSWRVNDKVNMKIQGHRCSNGCGEVYRKLLYVQY